MTPTTAQGRLARWFATRRAVPMISILRAAPQPGCHPFRYVEIAAQQPRETSGKPFVAVCLLAATVRQPMAGTAAKILPVGRQIQLTDAPIARHAPNHQRTSEPPSLTAELRGRGLQPNVNLNIFTIAPTVMKRDVVGAGEIVDAISKRPPAAAARRPMQRTRGPARQPTKLSDRQRERFFDGRFPATARMMATTKSAHTAPPPPRGFAKINCSGSIDAAL